VTTQEIQDIYEQLDTQERMFKDAIATLSAQIAELQEDPPTAKAKTPRRWQDRAGLCDWVTLAAWVDRLNDDYSLMNEYAIPQCWHLHAGLVDELSAVHQSWATAALAQEKGMAAAAGSDAMAIWIRQSLWPCLDRITTDAPQRYRSVRCATTHEPDAPAKR
jgi:hypothetical protein